MIENTEGRIITFPGGIPGFEEIKEFTLNTEDDACLARFAAVESPEIFFFLVRPQLFFPDYLPQVDLGAQETEVLGVRPEDKVDVWGIITVCSESLSDSTVNLRAPLLINAEAKKGMQLILSDETYSYRQPLFAAAAKESECAVERVVD